MKELLKIRLKIHMLNAATAGLTALQWGIKLASNMGTVFVIIASFGLVATGLFLVSLLFGLSMWTIWAAAAVIGLIMTIKQERDRKNSPR